MTISELINELVRIKRTQGDVDVTWIHDNQFADIKSVSVIGASNCPQNLRWCQSGKVAVIELDWE